MFVYQNKMFPYDSLCGDAVQSLRSWMCKKKNPRRFLLPHRALGTRWHRLNKQQKRKTERKQKHGNAAERLPAQPENQLCVHSCMKYGVSCAACRSPRTRSSSLHPTSLTTTQNRYIHRGSSWKKERKKKEKAASSFCSCRCFLFFLLLHVLDSFSVP